MNALIFSLFRGVAHSRVRSWPIAAFIVSWLLVACGGSGGSLLGGGVGSGGSGVAEGSVSGFGSVIVAGVEYDDTNATVWVEDAQGTSSNSNEVKLGQRVRIQHSNAGVADTIQLLPQLRGTASGAQDSQGVFRMLGQTVQTVSMSDAQNTATVMDGLSSVAAGDDIEVHGNWVHDSSRNHAVLIATRIEKLSVAADPVMVSGVVRSRSGSVLTLDDAQGQALQSTQWPTNLTAQSLITAWVPRSALTTSPWTAVRVIDASPSLKESEHLVLNTQVSARDVAQGEIRVQGMLVKLTNLTDNSPPSVGAIVQMEIVREGSAFKAIRVNQRQSNADLGGTVELKGSILWPANPTQLSLRSNWVNVPSNTLGNGCSSLRTNDSVYLEIKAQAVAPNQALRAISVSCNLQIPNTSVMEASGTLTQLNTVNKTMQVRTPNGSLNFVWNAATLLPANLNTLLNRNLEVEYQVVNGENRLRKVKPD
jgi:hypothetical protein